MQPLPVLPRFRISLFESFAGLAGLAAAAIHLVAEANGAFALSLAAKPVPVLLLAVAVARSARNRLRMPVAAGLLVSAIADAVIELPGQFLGGLALFLVAHVVYAHGFRRARPQLLAARALPVALYLVGMAFVLAPGLAAAGATMRAAVGLYMLAIGTMIWRAAALVGAPDLPAACGRLALGGAILFAASDSLIAIHRFVRPLPDVDLPIMLLYWAGQAGIAGAALAAGAAASGTIATANRQR